ncbi:hypothetical protein G6F62_014311 [Rhizopus arrhizus]|nr:hypothetical protein G6F62_014311 [Rhizopus arrhizus]
MLTVPAMRSCRLSGRLAGLHRRPRRRGCGGTVAAGYRRRRGAGAGRLPAGAPAVARAGCGTGRVGAVGGAGRRLPPHAAGGGSGGGAGAVAPVGQAQAAGPGRTAG